MTSAYPSAACSRSLNTLLSRHRPSASLLDLEPARASSNAELMSTQKRHALSCATRSDSSERSAPALERAVEQRHAEKYPRRASPQQRGLQHLAVLASLVPEERPQIPAILPPGVRRDPPARAAAASALPPNRRCSQ